MSMIKGNTGDSLTAPSPLVGEGRGEGAPLLDNAKKLRSNMTEVEKKLWYHLRAKRFADYKFRRQVPMHKYIADFICYDPRLIIELDGGQHTLQTKYDKKRDAFFAGEGFTVLRFWNNEMLENEEGVLLAILSALKNPPLPNPLPQGEREARASACCKEGKS